MIDRSSAIQDSSNHQISIILIMLIYFCSGLCSLIDEVIWVRLLKLTFGNTVYASSIVVSVFMGGLALGALIMSRFADRIQRPLFLYAILEICASLSALGVPLGLKGIDGFYRWFYVNAQPATGLLLILQVLISAFLILIPTMVMGSTLPLLGRYITKLHHQIGHRVGYLYLLNTFGASIGCFLAGFVLIRLLGVMGALYTAAVVNLFVAFGGFTLSRFYDRSLSGILLKPIQPSPRDVIDKKPKRWQYILMTAFFLSGMISIGYELIWMRGIVYRMGGFTYVFSAVLSIYLLGNVIGVWIGSRLSKQLKKPEIGFALSLTILGGLGVLFIPWFSFWYLKGQSFFYNTLNMTMDISTSIKFIFHILLNCAFLFLIPSIAMGIGFPLALQAWSNFKHLVGKTTGFVYGINTIGAVVGGLITGFVLIPYVGVQVSATLLGMIGICFGAMMFIAFIERWRSASRFIYYLGVLILIVITVFMPNQLFKHYILQSPNTQIIAYKEGITTTVTVEKLSDGFLNLLSDGVKISGDDHHRITQKTLGHLGVLINQNSKEVLSIGFGSGETTRCLSLHDLDRIDCVEIAPEVVDMALKYFNHINLGKQLHDEVNIVFMDGKNYLYLTPKKYDVIINGADIPQYSGSAPMFGKEHFQNGLDHLKPNGLFVTKLHLLDISPSNYNSILGTFLEVFPYVTIWYPTNKPYIFFYLIGSNEPQFFSPKYIEKQIIDERIGESVSYLNYFNSHDVLSCYIGDEKDIQRYLTSYATNSDMTPFVEYNLDNRQLLLDTFFEEFVGTVRSGSIYGHIDWSGMSDVEIQNWRTTHQKIYDASTYVYLSYHKLDMMEMLTNVWNGMKIDPEHHGLLEVENKLLSLVSEVLDYNPNISRNVINRLSSF